MYGKLPHIASIPIHVASLGQPRQTFANLVSCLLIAVTPFLSSQVVGGMGFTLRTAALPLDGGGLGGGDARSVVGLRRSSLADPRVIDALGIEVKHLLSARHRLPGIGSSSFPRFLRGAVTPTHPSPIEGEDFNDLP